MFNSCGVDMNNVLKGIVTGCIVNLHKKVREGLLEVRDRESYDRAR
jgi:hypothetical protein